MRGRRSELFVTLAFCSALASGCSRFDSSVSGTLSLDGQPLDRGTVTFHPVSPGPTAYGQVLSDGTFSVKVGDDAGLPSGGYKVGVRVVKEIPPRQEGDPPGFKSIIPRRYKNPQTSGFEYQIEKGKNEIDIQLNSDEART